MNRRLVTAYILTGYGFFASLIMALMLIIIIGVLSDLSLLLGSPAVTLARDASLVVGWVVALLMALSITAHFYLDYRLLSGETRPEVDE